MTIPLHSAVLIIALKLSRPQTSHSHPILPETAKETGLKISEDPDTIKVYAGYVSQRLKERSTNHVIEHFVPQKYEFLRADTDNTTIIPDLAVPTV